MDSITQLAVLTAATVIAASSAFAMAWLFLRGAFRLMQPAAVRSSASVRAELVPGTRAAARIFLLHR